MYKILLPSILLFLLCKPLIAQKKNLKSDSLIVYGNCEQCKKRIEKTLTNWGIAFAQWDIETKILKVGFDSTRFDDLKIQKKLADAGHDTRNFQASKKAYDRLPLCCHYARYQPSFDQKKDSAGLQPEPASMHIVTGLVLEEDQKGKFSPIAGATIQLLGANHFTQSDTQGIFQIETDIPALLQVSYIGFRPDTLSISSLSEIKIILKDLSTASMHEIVVEGRSPTTHISSLSAFNTMQMGSRELTKAACCNLSESFETSPSVDVSYTDAIRGIRQIQLLGLSESYVQLLTENTPEIRGLAGSSGLSFIPGSWMESIQLSKGAGSVVNGYEGLAGQINVEEIKPDHGDPLFINAYADQMGRIESSVDLSKKLNDRWSTSLLTHGDAELLKTDANKDGFMDLPLGRQLNLIDRWKYVDNKGFIAQFSVKALTDNRQGGQMDFDPEKDKFTANSYGVGIDQKQFNLTGKLGYIFPEQKYKSIGLILSASDYSNDSYYGLTSYQGKEGSFYANLIYQSIIQSTAHKFRTGLSFDDQSDRESMNSKNYSRQEIVPGIFFEYTYTNSWFTAIAGIREDHHNAYGFITTPRLHLKFDLDKKTNLRLSGGSGFRLADIFSENAGLFVSSRQYSILNRGSDYGYGLNPNKAWNYGANLVRQLNIRGHTGSLSLDLYHTYFIRQVVVDVDQSPQEILFYNLNGRSFASSIQLEWNQEIIKRLELRLAYRWMDVEQTYHGILMEKPLIARNRTLGNIAYETASHWKFDYTSQLIGKKRLPDTESNPAGKQFGDYSSPYVQMNVQVTRQFVRYWDVYTGVENLTGFTQKDRIIDPTEPFGKYFDASIVWGPVVGRMVYAGMRFKIK